MMIRSLLLSSVAMSGMVLMAAAGKATAGAVPPPPPPPAAPTFAYDFDFDVPESKAVGKKSKEPTAEQLAIQGMPAPNAEGKKASYLIAVTVPAEVTDAAERQKQFKASARTVTNRVGGIIRRHRKANDGEHKLKNFSVRTVMDEKLGFGVRIWRDADAVAEAPAA